MAGPGQGGREDLASARPQKHLPQPVHHHCLKLCARRAGSLWAGGKDEPQAAALSFPPAWDPGV